MKFFLKGSSDYNARYDAWCNERIAEDLSWHANEYAAHSFEESLFMSDGTVCVDSVKEALEYTWEMFSPQAHSSNFLVSKDCRCIENEDGSYLVDWTMLGFIGVYAANGVALHSPPQDKQFSIDDCTDLYSALEAKYKPAEVV